MRRFLISTFVKPKIDAEQQQLSMIYQEKITNYLRENEKKKENALVIY